MQMVISCQRPFDMWNLSGRVYQNVLKSPDLKDKIKIGSFALPSHLSSSARDFILQLIVVDPLKRLTTLQVMEQEWYQYCHV